MATVTSTLGKLDALCHRLLEGAQLKTHKYFRVAVPHALTGQSLVALVGEKGHAEDEAEANHLATLLLQYGYLFPVIEHAQTVRDDGTLYRLQRPYFWPSHSTQTDNVEYAIYLNKRLLRSEQRHGLEEDEIDAYNKLAELLAHMWGFITAQAELQLKQQKEKKKADKVVYDSEERAFWRMRRPGTANCLEQHVQKVERRLRKATAAGYRSLVDRLKFSIKTKPWLKALKASDTMVQWVDQLHDYDPLLATPQPSNPWITDDTQLWTLNTDAVEVPTERRVKRWGISVQELVKDPIGRQVLETFLESEFSSENIRFWIAIQDLKYSTNLEIEAKAERIYEEFLGPGAPCQVNVDQRTLERTMELLTSGNPRRHAFTHAEEHVFTLMNKDSYPRFVKSAIYKTWDSSGSRQPKMSRDESTTICGGMGAGIHAVPIPSTSSSSASSNQHHHHHHPQQQQQQQQPPLPKQLSSDSLPVNRQPQHLAKLEPPSE